MIMDTYEHKYKEALQKAKSLELPEYKNIMVSIFPELAESEDERVRKALVKAVSGTIEGTKLFGTNVTREDAITWLEKQGEQNPTPPKWKYKKDNTPLLRDSIILNKYGGVAKSPSGAIVSDVWVLDYDELAKLPKEKIEKQVPQEQDGFDTELNALLKKYEHLPKEEVVECLQFYLRVVQGKQKPKWTEEDESKVEDVIYFLDTAKVHYASTKALDDCITWLKSIKQRIEQ